MEDDTPPVRLFLRFPHLPSKEEGFKELSLFVLVPPDLKTVGDFYHYIANRFHIIPTSDHHAVVLELNGGIISPRESISIFRDMDKLRIEGACAVGTVDEIRPLKSFNFSRVEGASAMGTVDKIRPPKRTNVEQQLPRLFEKFVSLGEKTVGKDISMDE